MLILVAYYVPVHSKNIIYTEPGPGLGTGDPAEIRKSDRPLMGFTAKWEGRSIKVINTQMFVRQ